MNILVVTKAIWQTEALSIQSVGRVKEPDFRVVVAFVRGHKHARH